MRNYLVTIKNNTKKFTSIDQLNKIYQYHKRKGGLSWSSTKCIELDSLRRLHLHTIVTTPKVPYFKKYMIKGWHVHFKEFPTKDFNNVINYIRKNNKNKYEEQQDETKSFFHYHYGFSKIPIPCSIY